MNASQKIFVTGHLGMVGSSFLRLFKQKRYENIIYASRDELDLCSQLDVANFFRRHRPEVVIMSAAKVGGISANISDPFKFLFENLMIQNNIFEAAIKNEVKEIIFLGSSCIYPAACQQPMKEEYLLSGSLEPTNEGYALAKIAGLKMAKYLADQFGIRAISFIPCNLYGTNDHFNLSRAHVLSSLVKKFVDAVHNGEQLVTLWGTGIARREFMHVDDLANAVIALESRISNGSYINVGTGADVSIYDLAKIISEHAGYQGQIAWDSTQPNGMLQKLMDVSSIRELGFAPQISLDEGVKKTIDEYKILKNI